MEEFAIHTISRAGENVFGYLRKNLEKILKKGLTNGEGSGILGKLSDTDTRFQGAGKKVPKKMKKDLTKES